MHFINKNESDSYLEIKIGSKSLKNINKIEAEINSLLYLFDKHNKIIMPLDKC